VRGYLRWSTRRVRGGWGARGGDGWEWVCVRGVWARVCVYGVKDGVASGPVRSGVHE